MLVSRYCLSCLFFSALVSFNLTSECAAEVYRWIDSDGNTHYSTSPKQAGQKPAELPEIRKESISKRIDFLKDNAPKNCESHGGIDCLTGPDPSDASVQCRDGFTDSEQQFSDYCSNARLESKFLVEFSEEPKLLLHRKVFRGLRKVDPREPIALVAELRNLSGVKAEDIEVFFKVPYVMPRKLPADGPTNIPPYGVASYQFPYSQLPARATPRHLAEAQLKVSCENCEGVRVGR